MRSIKTKLIVGLAILIVFLFSVTAVLLVSEKERELTQDIYLKTRSFSELTTPIIIELNKIYLAEDSFVLFNRGMQDVFKKNEDASAIKIAKFNGEILYDSSLEKERQYEGPLRSLTDPLLLSRLKSNNPSFLIQDSNRAVYHKKDAEGNYLALDEQEKPIPEIQNTERISNIVYPFENQFAVIFDVSYDNLKARVSQTTERILYLLIFGVLIGLAFAYFFAGRITNPIQKLTESALIIGKGDFKHRVTVKGKDEVGVLGETFNKMAQDLEISTKAMIEKERLSKELEVAAKIQKEILPEKLPQIPGLDIAADLKPATEIGGDLYDVMKVADQYLMYIADVTGHGVPSGIVASIANALLYSYAPEKSMSDILIAANRVLKEKTAKNMLVTLLMLKYAGTDDGTVSYISAGHPEMVHYSFKEKKVFIEQGGGVALGMLPDISKNVQEKSLRLERGDCLVLYSDGITEALAENGKEMYGINRLKRAVNEYAELPEAEAVQKAILAEVELFIGKGVQSDDITILVIKRTV